MYLLEMPVPLSYLGLADMVHALRECGLYCSGGMRGIFEVFHIFKRGNWKESLMGH